MEAITRARRPEAGKGSSTLPDYAAGVERREQRGGRLGIWLVLTAGLVLFIASLVQSVAALQIFLAISQTVAAGNTSVMSTESPATTDLSMRPTPWLAEAQDLVRLAWANSRMVGSRESSEASAALLSSAMRDAERAVESAPGYGPGWLMLTDLRRRRGVPENDVAKLLKISILTAPFDPSRVLARIFIGFSVYSSLDAETRELLTSQIQMAWRHVPEDLVKFAVAPDRVDRLLLVRLALASDPRVLAEFEKLLRRMR
jgi:hypothetical protein